MKFLSLSVLFLLAASSASFGNDLHSVAPPEILRMDNLPNAGELLLKFCALGSHFCVERSTSCHGQCCDQGMADAEGYGCSGDVYGIVPPGFHYAGWRCQMYGAPTIDIPLSGDAGPTPEHPEQCTNRR